MIEKEIKDSNEENQRGVSLVGDCIVWIFGSEHLNYLSPVSDATGTNKPS